MDNEYIEKKERLAELAQKHGVENLRQLSLKAGLREPNLYSNLNGTYGMSIRRMFRIADAMGADIIEVVQALYPKEYAENQKKVPSAD